MAVLPPEPNAANPWEAKNRSQLIGGRSHDAVELVKAWAQGRTSLTMVDLLEKYKLALEGILKIADEVK